MKFFLKNAHRERGKGNSMEIFELNLTRRLENKYAPKSFAARWYAVRVAALISSYLFNLYSLITGAGAIFLFIYLGLSSIWPMWAVLGLGIGAGVVLGILLEVFKRKTAGETFAQGFSSGEWSFSGISGILALSALSIFLSFFAALSFPRTASAPPTPTQVNRSQYASFEDAIQYRKEQVANIKKQRQWKGRIGHQDQAEVNKLNAQIAQIEGDYLAHREATQAEADANHQKALTDYNASMGTMESIAGWVTGATELLFLCAFLYMEFYDWESAKERIKLENAMPDPIAQTPPPGGGAIVQPITTPHQAPPTNNRPKIGFKRYDDEWLNECIKEKIGEDATDIKTFFDKFDRIKEILDKKVPYEKETDQNEKTIPGNIEEQISSPISEMAGEKNISTIPVETTGENIEDNAIHIPYESPTQSVEVVNIELVEAEKFCAWCNSPMDYVSKRKIYCDDKCRWAAYNDRNKGGAKLGKMIDQYAINNTDRLLETIEMENTPFHIAKSAIVSSINFVSNEYGLQINANITLDELTSSPPVDDRWKVHKYVQFYARLRYEISTKIQNKGGANE